MPPLPPGSPKLGDVYMHYKGDSYRVVSIALHSNDDEWMVVYEPVYDSPDARYFTRPLREWSEVVEWGGEKKVRFEKI